MSYFFVMLLMLLVMLNRRQYLQPFAVVSIAAMSQIMISRSENN